MGPRVLVLGGADCALSDAEAFRRLARRHRPGADPPWDLVVACNDGGVVWPGRLDHWVSEHPTKITRRDPFHPEGLPWMEQRRQAGHPVEGITTWAARPEFRCTDEVLGGSWGGGSSGLLALQVALYLGGLAVLAGVPMDERPHVPSTTHETGVPWRGAAEFRKRWLQVPIPPGRVRSMSGWTRDTYGAPTPEWWWGEGAFPVDVGVVLGGGPGVWREAEAARSMLDPGTTVAFAACNDVACHGPEHLDVWVTLHPAKLKGWVEARRGAGLPPAGLHVAQRPLSSLEVRDGAVTAHERVVPQRWAGSCGLYGVETLRHLGAERIVLAGVPLDASGHFPETTEEHNLDATALGIFRRHWARRKDAMEHHVRSLSGWTRQLLGPPTPEWVNHG